MKTTCTNCGSSDLVWDEGKQNLSGVQDGRLRMHEVQPILFLGCNECSETLAVVQLSEVVGFLNKYKYELMEEVVRLRG